MDNDVFRSPYSLKGFANQLLTSLHQHLYRNIIRNMIALD